MSGGVPVDVIAEEAKTRGQSLRVETRNRCLATLTIRNDP